MSRIFDDDHSSATARVLPHLTDRRCVFCATTLDVHQAVRGGICADPACRKKQVVESAAQRIRQNVAEVRRAAFEFRARIAAAAGMADPQSLALAIVPGFHRPVVKLARARRLEIRAHLIRVVRQAFEENLDNAGVHALAEELSQAVQPPPEFPHGSAACATCRGYCCRGGGTHAYLNISVIRSYIARHPGLRWRRVVQAFLKELPNTSFDDSCVYHGRRGCALPREMRSSTCNQYYCEGLMELRAALAASKPRPVLVGVASGKKIGRSILIKLDGSVVRVRRIPKAKPEPGISTKCLG